MLWFFFFSVSDQGLTFQGDWTERVHWWNARCSARTFCVLCFYVFLFSVQRSDGSKRGANEANVVATVVVRWGWRHNGYGVF